MKQKTEYNVWTKWDPLKKVVVGNCVNPNFFEHVKNIEIKEKCQQIMIETQEDLDNLASTMKQLGAEVVRTDMSKSYYPQTLDPDKKAVGIGGVMNPRDHYAVLGNHIIGKDLQMMTRNLHPEIVPDNLIHKNTAWYDLHMKRKVSIETPNWTIVGDDLFVDTDTNGSLYPVHNKNIRETIEQWAKKWLPGVKMHWMSIGAHNDSCFHTLKPGVIISLRDVHKYADSFPDWEVLYLKDQSWDLMSPFTIMKEKTYGKYWIPGEEKNTHLVDFINHYLQEWLGYAEETVFDVNLIMANESTACVCGYNKLTFEFFKKHKIEPIICPLRHRYFFDGGLHCVTLDTFREGEKRSIIAHK